MALIAISFKQGEMKTLLDNVCKPHDQVYRRTWLSKIMIFFCAAKMEIQRNDAAFWNFIRKSDEIGPKYWKVPQTGTLSAWLWEI